jgi:hypothetical protein
MKNLLFIAMCIFAIGAKSQTVGTENVTAHCKWKFGGSVISTQHINDTIDNKTSVTTWNLYDTVNHVLVRSDKFTYTDTAFNTWWDNYTGFFSMYEELRIKEGLPPIDSSVVEDMFYNKHVAPKQRLFPPFKIR